MPGSHQAYCQKLQEPPRWMEAFRNVLPLYQRDTVTLCFIGDVMMHQSQIDHAYRNGSYDFSSYFHLIEDRLSGADLTIANMEFALGGEPYTGYPAFSAPDQIAEYAADCGIDIFLTANNHIYDRGAPGAERTLDIYREMNKTHGVHFTGIASNEEEACRISPLMLRVKGIRLAFLNFTYGTNGGRIFGWPKVNYMEERTAISKDLERAQDLEADFITVLPHWGNEYELIHAREQEETAEWLVENGADMIIGTHPHVVQDTASFNAESRYGKVPVAYSLGNAVSNMSARNTQLELLVTARITRHCNGDIKILPPELTFLWCSRPGGYNSEYTVVPVTDFIGKRDCWLGKWDYDNMIETYIRVKETTGITDINKINEQ